MAIDDELSKVAGLYTENLKKHGAQSNAVGWNTDDCQLLRFDKLSSIINEEPRSCTVNDYGCGYAAHLQYLLKNGVQVSGYNGYDLSADMLEEAKEQTKESGVIVNLLNSKKITTTADYTFVSGTFNVRFASTDDEWMGFIRGKLGEINRYTNKSFSFNLLTSYVDWKEPHLYYGDPCYWFDYCKQNFSKKVLLLHDYDLWEWTIVVIKD